ncbi:MAG: four helix bundle protein [Bacteroidetes bacterium]|nr:four helix bundle protein [Bacteroidota bacterium]
MHKFKDLIVYQKALVFTTRVRNVSGEFPKEEQYVLSAQFRRAADSIVLNIAEGAGDSSDKEFVRFLGYSLRSTFECIGCLDIALMNKYIDAETNTELSNLCNEIIAMLYALQRSYK